MIKRLLPLLAVPIFLAFGCNQSVQTTEETVADTVQLTVATFDTAAPYYIDEIVWIEGTVFHTCKHGGKRMFLVDGNDSVMVEITAGPDMVSFDQSLEGSRIMILGVLLEERIDEKYLNEWEAEVLKPEEENHEVGIHEGTVGHEDHSKEDKLKQINNLRQQLKESGNDHLSFFSIEAISFEELPDGDILETETEEDIIEE